MVYIRVNPKYVDEFEMLIKDIENTHYKVKVERNIKENKIRKEFSDWKYEFKNSTKKYYEYPLYTFTSLNEQHKSILSEIFGCKITNKSLWYKRDENDDVLNPDVKESDSYENNHMIYVITKGRWDTNYTVKSLEKMRVKKYRVVIERDEVDNYIKSGIDISKIIIFDKPKVENKSGIPVRNFVWLFSREMGETHHWILDDNIEGFFRWNRNKRFEVRNASPFVHIEEYMATKNNVAQCGMNYRCFHNDIDYIKDLITKNTRIYSCILIKNDLPKLKLKKLLWRGQFNEDTDLSLRILKAGYATLLFNNYLCGKKQTGTVKGGNQQLYKNYTDEGYKEKTDSLIAQHPDVVKYTKRFGKQYHHQVDYKPFKNNKLSV